MTGKKVTKSSRYNARPLDSFEPSTRNKNVAYNISDDLRMFRRGINVEQDTRLVIGFCVLVASWVREIKYLGVWWQFKAVLWHGLFWSVSARHLLGCYGMLPSLMIYNACRYFEHFKVRLHFSATKWLLTQVRLPRESNQLVYVHAGWQFSIQI